MFKIVNMSINIPEEHGILHKIKFNFNAITLLMENTIGGNIDNIIVIV